MSASSCRLSNILIQHSDALNEDGKVAVLISPLVGCNHLDSTLTTSNILRRAWTKFSATMNLITSAQWHDGVFPTDCSDGERYWLHGATVTLWTVLYLSRGDSMSVDASPATKTGWLLSYTKQTRMYSTDIQHLKRGSSCPYGLRSLVLLYLIHNIHLAFLME
jgi:hypothetical protein